MHGLQNEQYEQVTTSIAGGTEVALLSVGSDLWKGMGMRLSRIRGCLSVALLSLLLAPGSALAYVAVTIDGGLPIVVPESTDGTNYFVEDYDLWNPGANPGDPNDPNNEWHITLNVFLDPDPQIVYAMSVLDFGGPSTFGFIFGLPIVPTAAPGIVTHSESSSTTDGGADGTTVTALAPPGGIPVDTDGITEQFVYTLSQNGGTTFLNAGLDIRPSFVGATPSDTQAAVNLGPIAGPAGAGFYNFMRVDVNFMMGGGQDAYTWNGIATVVPEPATAALLGLGLGGLALAGRRRLRQ
jgi:hypothetical protein